MVTTMKVDKEEEMSSKEQATRKSPNEEKEESWCPLFSEGLPSDFASNSKLAAIASLLNDDSTDGSDDGDSQHSAGNEDQNNMVDHAPASNMSSGKSCFYTHRGNSPRGGGRKFKRNNRRQRKSGMPYDKDKHAKISPAKRTSVGEAQLFLNLWKL